MAAGLATLEELEAQRLSERAARMGELLLERTRPLAERYEVVVVVPLFSDHRILTGRRPRLERDQDPLAARSLGRGRGVVRRGAGRHARASRKAAAGNGALRPQGRTGKPPAPRSLRQDGLAAPQSRRTRTSVVWREDAGQCAFVAPDGRRCSRKHLVALRAAQSIRSGTDLRTPPAAHAERDRVRAHEGVRLLKAGAGYFT